MGGLLLDDMYKIITKSKRIVKELAFLRTPFEISFQEQYSLNFFQTIHFCLEPHR